MTIKLTYDPQRLLAGREWYMPGSLDVKWFIWWCKLSLNINDNYLPKWEAMIQIYKMILCGSSYKLFTQWFQLPLLRCRSKCQCQRALGRIVTRPLHTALTDFPFHFLTLSCKCPCVGLRKERVYWPGNILPRYTSLGMLFWKSNQQKLLWFPGRSSWPQVWRSMLLERTICS